MTGSASETADTRLKRLKIRSWRRGTKEMDIILGGFFDRHGAGLGADELDRYEALLDENDQDLYRWVTGAEPPPPAHAAMLSRIAAAFPGKRE